MDKYWIDWQVGYKHFKEGYPQPMNNVSKGYKAGYESAEMQFAVMYELEQIDTARSLYNEHH